MALSDLFPATHYALGRRYSTGVRLPVALLGYENISNLERFAGATHAPTFLIDPTNAKTLSGGTVAAYDSFRGASWVSDTGVTIGDINGAPALSLDGTGALNPTTNDVHINPTAWTVYMVIHQDSTGAKSILGPVDDPATAEERFSIGHFAADLKIDDRNPDRATEATFVGALNGPTVLVLSQSKYGTSATVNGGETITKAENAPLVDNPILNRFQIGGVGSSTVGRYIGALGVMAGYGTDHFHPAHEQFRKEMTAELMALYGIPAP